MWVLGTAMMNISPNTWTGAYIAIDHVQAEHYNDGCCTPESLTCRTL